MTISVLRNLAAVRPDAEETMTATGLVLPPRRDKEKLQTGVIVSFGPDMHDVEVGDRVIFGRFAGTEVVHEGETLVLLQAEEVLAVLVSE